MWPWQWQWDWQTGATWVGILATFVLGLFNLFVSRAHNDKTRFINTVTNQRVIWLEQLRGDISKFVALADGLIEDPKDTPSAQLRADRHDLRRLRRLITLRLNPKDDAVIAALLPDIEKAALTKTQTDRDRGLDKLAELSGQLLKVEWDKVQDEAEKGRLKRSKKGEKDKLETSAPSLVAQSPPAGGSARPVD